MDTTKPLRVVIIDDDPISHFISKKIIYGCDPDCSVVSFLDPQVAVDYIELHNHDDLRLPDVILLDINMPHLDGFDVLDRLTVMDIRKDIQIVMLTSSVNGGDVKRASQYSIVKGFHSKPLSREKFLEIRNGV